MSIIRQRKKNLIMAWILGATMSMIIIMVLGYIFREKLQVFLELPTKIVEIEDNRVETLVASRPIEKGTILEFGDIEIILVDPTYMVKEQFESVEALVGKKLILDTDKYLPFTAPMFMDSEIVDKNLRLHEYSFVELPYLLEVGDVVDVRIAFPTGQDYIILSQKSIKGYERTVENVHKGLLNIVIEEEEILLMSSAMVDAYLIDGTKVYMVKYVSPDQQEAAIVNYPMNQSVLMLFNNNPNIKNMPNIEDVVALRALLDSAVFELLDEDGERFNTVDMTTPAMSIDSTSEEVVVEENVEVVERGTTESTESEELSGDETQGTGGGF